MAQLDIHGCDDLLSKLNQLGRFEEVAPKMMEDGMEILHKAVIEEASKHVDSGKMLESIKPTGLSKLANGSYYMCTRPTGKDNRSGKWKNARKGKGEGKGRTAVRNMEKIIWLELGVKGRPATPVITKAVIRASPEVIAAMRNRFRKEVGL